MTISNNSPSQPAKNKVFSGEHGFGRYLEDFEIGVLYKHWPQKTITSGEHQLFCLLTMNHHPVHLDVEYASKQLHGKILVVGTYVLSLVVGLSVRDISGLAIANLEYEQVVHNGPVFIGDTLRAQTVVLSSNPSKSKPDRGIIYVETTAFNQNGEKVLTLRRKVLIPRRTKQGEM